MAGGAGTHQTLRSLGLLEGAEVEGPAPGTKPVAGLASDSREVARDGVFFALPGTAAHGAKFVRYALRMGAGAVVTDAAGAAVIAADAEVPDPLAVPVLIHAAPRLALARAAARWWGAQPEVVAAVTGTNGKTSVASFTRQLWAALGHRAVSLGTTGVEGALRRPLAHTTPDPLTLHAMLAELAGEGVSHAAMEASSHGLAQHRLDGVRLSAAAFTNLSRDHLDYHPTIEDYIAAKLGLFGRVLPEGGLAVINLDDPVGVEAAALARSRGQRVIGVGRAAEADLRLQGAEFDRTGQVLHLGWARANVAVALKLIGGFQGENAAIAAGLVIGLGADPMEVFSAMVGLRPVRGRMELAATRANGAAVFVDYAHTPASVGAALRALRPHVEGRIVVVVGAGGDRDPGKRPMMGAEAAAAA
ncbi:MAG: UDP-N-acetylmuramoyl-L-alanyl-D-glutamate--2,6-diaminopimelate ligase, partial [Pseudomonadota bacterium]